MALTDRDWINHAVGTVRESFELLFDTRTVRLLALGGLALGVATLASSTRFFSQAKVAGTSINTIAVGALFYTGLLLIMLTILSGLLTLRRPGLRSIGKGVEPGAPSVLGGQLILGIDVSRSQVSYGALYLKYVESYEEEASQLAKVRMEELVPTRVAGLRPGTSRRELYEALMFVVLDLIDALEEKFGQERITISGIAVTTPSWIDLSTKTLASPIGPFPVNEAVVDSLAKYLWEEHPERIKKAFGTSESPVISERDLAEKIYLDVDSRSVTRYDLHKRLRADSAWTNYACVIIVEGIGAGLVLNEEIYYGSHGSEGEVGHTTVHLDPSFRMPGATGPSIHIDRCDCQLLGFHWETLGSTNGLLLLAESLNKQGFDALTEAHCRSLTGHDLIDAASLAMNGKPVDGMPHQVADLVLGDSMYQTYLDRLFKEYARILTIGIANLVNVLDLEHVVIGGETMKDLDRLDFRNEIWNCWNDYVLRGRSVNYSFASLKQLWQGAALLFWDPSYRRRLL